MLLGSTSAYSSCEPGTTSDPGKVLHQQRADALPLVRIVHSEGDLGRSGLRDDVARPADDDRASILLEHRHQRDVVHEVDRR